MPVQVCPECGAANRMGAKFCNGCGCPLAGTVDWLLPNGTILKGQYKILQLLGGGGMGAVYLAEDMKLYGRLVAAKELLSPLTDPEERAQARAMFEQEARLLATLRQRNLPMIFEFFSERNRQYLVMEYIEGKNLLEILESSKGFLSEAQAIKWALQVCDALAYLHGQQPPVIFRDVKPQNIMIDKDEVIKLIDFGIARLFNPRKVEDTALLGTPGYAPPEQYGKGQTDVRSDVYALGVTLHQLLTRHDPSETPFSLPAPRKLNPSISSHMERVILKATQSDVAARFQSIAEMREAILAKMVPEVMPAVRVQLQRIKPFRIALRCSLEEAQTKMLTGEWGGRIANIAEYIISRSKRVEGDTILLRGYQGFGGTSIAQEVRERVQKELGDKLATAWVDFSELGSTWEPIKVLEAVLDELRAGVKAKELRKAIDDIYQPLTGKVHIEDKSRKDKIFLEIHPLLSFGIDIPLPGGGRLSIQPPIKYVRETFIEETAKGPLPLERSAETLLRALMSLVDYFVARGVTVLLIFDKVDDIKILTQLHPIATRRGVFSIIVVDEDRYDQWENQRENIMQWLAKRKSFYMDCLWDMPRSLCWELTRGCREADTEEFEAFIRYIEFYGRGRPAWVYRAIDEFYEPPGKKWRRLPEWIRDALKFILEEEDEPAYLHVKRSRIQKIQRDAELQKLLEDGWDAIFFDKVHQISMLDDLDPQRLDQAKLGVYKLVDWMKEQAQRGNKFPKTALRDYARGDCHIPLPSDQIVESLVTFLSSQKKLASTTKGLDASGMLRAPSVTAYHGRMG